MYSVYTIVTYTMNYLLLLLLAFHFIALCCIHCRLLVVVSEMHRIHHL